MPRDSNGNYSLPAGTLTNTGDTLLVSQHNPAMQDLGASVGNSLDRDGTGGMRAALNMGGNPVQGLLPGVNPNDAATVGQIAGSSFPPGAIIDFAGPSAPSGWLLCGGQSLSRTDYPALFAAIGTTYGSVNGASFSLPDLRGRVTAGKDFSAPGMAGRLTNTTMTPDGATLGAVGGAQTQTLTEAQMPAHTHAVTGTTNATGSHVHSSVGGNTALVGGAATIEVVTPNPSNTGAAGEHSHTITGTATSAGAGTAHPNVQPTILLNKIIKV